MTLPGAEVMKAGFMGEEIFLPILGFEDFGLPLISEDAILCSSDPLISAQPSVESRGLFLLCVFVKAGCHRSSHTPGSLSRGSLCCQDIPQSDDAVRCPRKQFEYGFAPLSKLHEAASYAVNLLCAIWYWLRKIVGVRRHGDK